MSCFSSKFPLLALGITFATGMALPADASSQDRRFFEQVQGQWTGPGEIVAGKYKGTKFVCNFAGSMPEDKIGMALDGGCRVGLFNQDMSARVERVASGYRGTFLDGAKGKGLDVVGGAVDGAKAVLAIHRNELTGAMRAEMLDQNTMNVTISVHVQEELVPVIGVQLKRTGGRSVGSVASK